MENRFKEVNSDLVKVAKAAQALGEAIGTLFSSLKRAFQELWEEISTYNESDFENERPYPLLSKKDRAVINQFKPSQIMNRKPLTIRARSNC